MQWNIRARGCVKLSTHSCYSGLCSVHRVRWFCGRWVTSAWKRSYRRLHGNDDIRFAQNELEWNRITWAHTNVSNLSFTSDPKMQSQHSAQQPLNQTWIFRHVGGLLLYQCIRAEQFYPIPKYPNPKINCIQTCFHPSFVCGETTKYLYILLSSCMKPAGDDLSAADVLSLTALHGVMQLLIQF